MIKSFKNPAALAPLFMALAHGPCTSCCGPCPRPLPRKTAPFQPSKRYVSTGTPGFSDIPTALCHVMNDPLHILTYL